MEQIIYGRTKIQFEGVTINPQFKAKIPTLGIHLNCHMHQWDKVTQWYWENEFTVTWDGYLFYVNGIEVNEFVEVPYSEKFCIKIKTVHNHIGHVDGLIITTEASTMPRHPLVRTYDIHEPTGLQINVKEFKKV